MNSLLDCNLAGRLVLLWHVNHAWKEYVVQAAANTLRVLLSNSVTLNAFICLADFPNEGFSIRTVSWNFLAGLI